MDGASGKQLWRYDPQSWKFNARGLRTVQGYHRGVAYLDGRLFLGTSDGRLVALDAKTGTVIWTVDTVQESDSRKQITGAPRVFNGKVIIGSGGADFGHVAMSPPTMQRAAGKPWRFYTVPGDRREEY